MTKNILATLSFYNLLEQPLSSVEIFRYLINIDRNNIKPIFGEIFKLLPTESIIYEKNKWRQKIKREKISAQKWKKVEKICQLLQYMPFIRGVGVTGSLTFNNAREQSDFDLLIITKSNRIWSARAIVSVVLGLLNQKRYGNNTKDKVCLNCFLAEDALNIKEEIKPHNIYSAQEYSRLIPILEYRAGLWDEFKRANHWINDYLYFYPWPTNTFLFLLSNYIANIFRKACELILFSPFGDFSEIICKKYQIKRIKKNLTTQPDDQIFFNDQCLLFHPHSKSIKILEQFNKAVDKSI